MNKKISLGTCIALIFLVAAVCISATMYLSINVFNKQLANVGERSAMFDKFSEIDQKVRQNYAGTIDEEKLNDEIAKGYIKGIDDKYGVYFTGEEYNNMQNRLNGKDVGIGIRAGENTDGNIYIYSVIKNTPAQRAGIIKGDIIFEIDNKKVKSIGFDKAVEMMLGEEGKNLKFKILRDEKEIEFDITRDDYSSYSVEYKTINDIGYIKIYEFNNNTAEQFKEAITQLQMRRISGLVFDVRNNPGGTLDSVAKTLDMLLPAGTIVSSTDKDGVNTPLYTSDANEIDLSMMVLINKKSASAAELFASALRDFEKAQLVGEKTYGKGSMQTIFKLSDGSAIDLTIAKFNPPKSQNFEGIGLEPDFEVKLSETNEKYFYLMKDTEDTQLVKAFEELGSTVEDIIEEYDEINDNFSSKPIE